LNKNMLKTKKAISPILATLLLIVIAVAAIVVTYAWVMTYMSTTTQRAGEELRVENVRFHDSINVTITLRSTGTSSRESCSYIRRSIFNEPRSPIYCKPLYYERSLNRSRCIENIHC